MSIQQSTHAGGEAERLWIKYSLPKNEGTRLHRLGETILCVGVQMAGDGDILTAMPIYPSEGGPKKKTRGKGDLSVSLPPMDAPEWTRYYMGNSADYELTPGYPPVPVCVKLSESFSLAPGTDLKGWIFSRLDACIIVAGSIAAQFPLSKPFKTLYGTPDSGVVCRYDTADFLASSEPMADSLHGDPGLVAHPVRLKNSSQEPVCVSELCIYGEQLSIFGVNSWMQSERLLFNFSASGVRMSLEGQGALPAGWSLIAKPRLSGEERFIERSIELIRAMTRM